MIINEERRQYIKRHVAIPLSGVPAAVVEAIGVVVPDDASIEAAWTDWSSTDSTTTWTCWIVTPKVIGHVRVEYDKVDYDEHVDRGEHKLAPSSQSVWVRRLSNIIEVRWGAVYEAPERDNDYCPAEPISVKFADWETVIPDDFGISVERRSAADGLLTALRQGAGF